MVEENINQEFRLKNTNETRETGESMFCAAFLSKKSNLLDFSIKIGIQPSLSWFDQSLVISCLI